MAGGPAHRFHNNEYRQLFRQMLEAYALHEAILDSRGNLVDFRFLEVNPAFERTTGLKAGEVVGRTVLEVLPDLEPEWFRSFGEVVKSGLPTHVARYMGPLKRTLDVAAYRPRHGYFVTVFRDLTPLEQAKRSVEQTATRLKEALATTIDMLGAVTELRDPYTAGHQKRVSDLARAIAVKMEMREEAVTTVRFGALLHDIGKMAVPLEILNRSSGLGHAHYRLIQIHPATGYEIVKRANFPWALADVVAQHHERMDGSGYPEGLAGDAIRPEARVVAVADVVESMCTRRPYRDALPLSAGLAEIWRNRGKLYDPAAVQACLSIFREGYRFERAAGE